mgnify:CR=1 FL=1
MEQERVEVEKRQKRQEFLKVINSGDCPEDRVLTDEGGADGYCASSGGKILACTALV